MVEKVQIWCWGLLCFLLPWLGFISPRSAAALFVVAATAVLLLEIARAQMLDSLNSRGWFCVLGILVAAGISLLWVPDVGIALERLVKIAVFLPLGLALLLLVKNVPQNKKLVLETTLVSGMLVGLLFLVVRIMQLGAENTFGQQLTNLEMSAAVNRPSVVLLMCLSAAMAAVSRTKYSLLGWGYSVALLLLFLFSTSQTALLGLVVWFFAFGFYRMLPKQTMSLLIYGGVALILLHPAIILLVEAWDSDRMIDFQAGSIGARLDIWYAVAHKICEAPFFGHGLEAVRSLNNWPAEFVYYSGTSIPHPHNGVLQIWAEFGALGALAMSAGWVWLVSQVRRFDEDARPAIAAALSAFATVLCVSHGVWQSWWLGAVFGSAALVLLTIGWNKRATHIQQA